MVQTLLENKFYHETTKTKVPIAPHLHKIITCIFIAVLSSKAVGLLTLFHIYLKFWIVFISHLFEILDCFDFVTKSMYHFACPFLRVLQKYPQQAYNHTVWRMAENMSILSQTQGGFEPALTPT